MAWAKEIMQGGTSAGTAKAINGGVSASITAAGTTQTDAFDLNASINVITTAAASTGVQIPSLEIGDETEILNLGANSVTVYPASGERINSLTTNTGFVLATATAVKVRKFTTTRNVAWLSA